MYKRRRCLMDETTRNCIRNIFLSPRPNVPLFSAAGLLRMSFEELKKEIADGVIVAVSTRLGQRVTHEEMVTAAMRRWEQGVIEEALGDDAAAVLPEAIRLVELRARVPRYKRRCCITSPDGATPPSMKFSPASSRTWPARMPRSFRRRFPGSRMLSRGRESQVFQPSK
jgi:hypothetical protein